MPGEYYIGCISGTSLDGLDLALLDFSKNSPKVAYSECATIPPDLQSELGKLCSPGPNEIERLGRADVEFGMFIGNCINRLIAKHSIDREEIRAVGSHGQTIRHRPDINHPFSMQVGAISAIAETTGITTVGDFRMADIMVGGQGAPLVPAFHHQVFSSNEYQRLIINLGGISNLTVLPKGDTAQIQGYDIGPANTLLDRWTETHLGKSYDESGKWARSGKLLPSLLADMLKDEYFSRPTPKSTGREYFNMQWLEQFKIENQKPEDIQRTLLELAASTVVAAVIQEKNHQPTEIYVCGGGAHNTFLLERIEALSGAPHIGKTDALGIPVDDVEAAAFAWLARETLEGRPGNLPSVTGATKPKILGAICHP